MLAQPLAERNGAEANGDPPPPAKAEAVPERRWRSCRRLTMYRRCRGRAIPIRRTPAPANKPLPTLVLLLADASAKGFSYANLDTVDLLPSSDPGQGPVIVLTFAGITATEILLSGRNLDGLYLPLCFHRVAWIRERSPSRDFIPAAETVITGITITEVES